MCSFVVNQGQYALVFAMGEIKSVVNQPGLYFKLPTPLQSITKFEGRIQTLDNIELIQARTLENKTLHVNTFIKWRIIDPKTFYFKFHSNNNMNTAAEIQISTSIKEAITQAINKHTANTIISQQRDAIMDSILTKSQPHFKDIGVELVDIRLKDISFIPEINEIIFSRMTAERKRIANEYRATGIAEGEKIRAEAERERDRIIGEAYYKAQAIKGEGDAAVGGLYANSFGANAEFYSFYRSLEAYRASFKNKQDVLVVDPASDFFKYFRSPNPNAGNSITR